jgi:hypothetical protein
MTMDDRDLSQPITIELGPTFGSTSSDVSRVRNGQISWINEMDVNADPIFTLEMPLELVGVAAGKSPSSADSLQIPPSSLTFVPTGDITVHGVTPDSPVRDQLLGDGEMGMSVDTLSRSVILTDVDERTFIEVLRTRDDIDTVSLDALKRALLVPAFYDEFDDVAATNAQDLLTENIRRHEREHVRCLIDPDTAIWREFELYWRSIFVGAKQQTWTDASFLNRLAALYRTPSRFTIELLAMLTEDYATDDPAVQRAVEAGVAAQRGAENALLRVLKNQGVDADALLETMRSPVAEQYCDLWLAYVIDTLRSGYSLDEIDATGFHRTCDPLADSHDTVVSDSEARTMYVDLMRDRLLGPVFELVRLKFVDGTFALERAWHSLNPGVSDRKSLVAVRRVLFRRQFLSDFAFRSGLEDVLHERERAVKQVIKGTSLDESSLFDRSHIRSTDDWADHLAPAYEAAATALLGTTATVDDLHTWLNDPEYDFT